MKTVRIVNDNFQSYIFDVESYEYESYFKQFFDNSNMNESFLIVLRVNVVEQIELVKKVNLDLTIGNFDDGNKDTETYLQPIQEELKKIQEKVKSVMK